MSKGNFIYCEKGAFPKESCDNLIDFFDNNMSLASPGKYTDYGGEIDNLEIPVDISNPDDNYGIGRYVQNGMFNYRKRYPLNNTHLGKWTISTSCQLMRYEPDKYYDRIHCENDCYYRPSVERCFAWMFYLNDISYSFIHNGTVNKEILYDLITESGTDLTWLELYPPQTFGGGDWKSSGWTNVVDSELILLYIMKEVQYHEDIVIGFQTAVINMINAGTSASQLNLIFSDGGSLFIFGGSHGLYTTESSDYYSIMTQPPNNDGNEWTGIANEEMIVINSGGIVRYPDFVTNDMEDDHDIYPLSFTMSPAYPNPFNASVYFVLDGQTSEHVNISIYSIIGKQVDQFFIPRLNGQQSKIGWSPSLNVPSGTYFIQASTNYFNETRKILFIK